MTITFDSHAYVKKLRDAGVDERQAEIQAETLAGVLQKAEESSLKELATKGDVREVELRLEAKIETAKVDTIKWVIATGIIILGGVATINRIFPPAPVYHTPQAQEMRLPTPPPAPPVPAVTPPAR